MRLIPDSNNIARIIEIPGVKKTTELIRLEILLKGISYELYNNNHISTWHNSRRFY